MFNFIAVICAIAVFFGIIYAFVYFAMLGVAVTFGLTIVSYAAIFWWSVVISLISVRLHLVKNT